MNTYRPIAAVCLACFAGPVDGVETSQPLVSSAALVSSAPAAGCLSSATAVGACWEKELEKVRQAGEACQADIDAFCEGIQVGEGRLEACLKAHKRKLSKKCRESLTPSFPRTRESSTR